MSRSVQCANGSKNVLKLHMQRRRSIPNGNKRNQQSSSTFRRRRRTWSFHVIVLQRTAKEYIFNARAQLLFCSLNLLLITRCAASYCQDLLAKCRNTVLVQLIAKTRKRRLVLHTALKIEYQRRQLLVELPCFTVLLSANNNGAAVMAVFSSGLHVSNDFLQFAIPTQRSNAKIQRHIRFSPPRTS